MLKYMPHVDFQQRVPEVLEDVHSAGNQFSKSSRIIGSIMDRIQGAQPTSWHPTVCQADQHV